ncbi:DUF1311 domain-containing protein [Sphingomonas koreensis]|jgi:uncharacterized protein YecT (DUF1311 family)|uniref:DUF1311 domain-containing protein n=1 Tax=Sphingomonas koreensis TaxID=93064 RepID=A0A1L6JDA7_9SPHN|nr:lysozyme inhibitor LprI family protein [Sphingomonas koreensis]APR53797.1 hypothetical protein BRX40_16455 [Sphingomonas koreensis]MDC7808646.1 lysozyme inhibitor LprI family protein [Sphingomonas koreensis]RSU17871.1 DUF1311 domain-containing protein [Sphingomonas koreensis]RSU23231.1 DUF1311 domain-containing protein [Sphingomonas koreensis]RSU23324.1 DUF1311 domain-containing protein [Sphingomonas koreensis]
MILLTLLAAAQTQTIDCDNAVTQSAMTQCARQSFAKADALLNAEYRQTMAIMRKLDAEPGSHPAGDTRPGYAAALTEAQRAWIAFRDAHCRTMGYQMRGGSAEPMLVWGCRETLTRDRTEQLIDLRKN